MGCDIHLYKEKQVSGKWVAADEWVSYDYGDEGKGIEVPWEKRFTVRNYDLFGLLSKGVRREYPFSFEPRGIPHNASPEVAEKSQSWGIDGHSHNYLYVYELKDMAAYLKEATVRISGMKDATELKALQGTIDEGKPVWDLLYPYCQMTNAPGSVEFEIDVPADFIVGGSEHGLNSIIQSFEGVEGDNHRIVFWFDN